MSKTSKVQIQDRVSSKQSWELSCRVVPLGLSFGEFVVAFEFSLLNSMLRVHCAEGYIP